MPTMAQNDKMPNIREQILLTLWKLKGIAKAAIKEEVLRAEMGTEPSAETWASEIEQLHQQGFLEKKDLNGKTFISLTALGLAILRQIEEDHLQELK
jgi:predicted transcriptional regulator